MAPVTPAGRGEPRGFAAGPSGTALVGIACLLVLAAVAVGLLAGAAGATVPGATLAESNDTTGPSVGNLTRVDYTTVELRITDDTDVDEATIDGADLFVSDGRVANVTAAENGSNATVTIRLESRIDTDRLGVAIADGASIYDAAGNELNESGDVWRYVEGMDGVAPSITLYEVDNGSGDRINVRIRTTEDLAGLSVRLYGPADRWLTLSNFTKPSDIPEYVAGVEPPASGSYRVTVVNVTDRYNNSWTSGRDQTIEVDAVPPTAVAAVDFGASGGRTIAFDANRSSDDTAIRGVHWDFGDGANATGWGPTHTFERGNYTVTLTVTDTFGNVGTDRLVLNLTNRNASTALVEDDRGAARVSGAGTASAIATVARPTAGEPIEIARRSGAPLASIGGVSLDRLTVTLANNDSLRLAVEATDPAGVRDVRDAGAGEPVGGLTVVHDAPERAVDSVRFRFGVDRERLESAGIDPAAIRLYRYHDGSWVELSTAQLNASNGSHRYRATSPGLSRFAIAPATAADEEGTTEASTPTEPPTTAAAALRVTDASLNRSAVPAGGAVRVEATVRNEGDSRAPFTAGLTADGQLVATETVSVPAGGTAAVAFDYRPNATADVAVNGTAAGTVTVESAEGGPLLGFLPLGFLGTALTYLGAIVAAIFLLLKAAALYLDY